MTENSAAYDEKNPPLVHATPAPAEENEPEGAEAHAGDDKKGHDKMVASGVAGAVLGFFFGGPIGSVLFGFTAAYASRKQDRVGEVARSLGDLAVKTQQKAIEVDEKHKVVDRSTRMASEAAQKIDPTDNVVGKVKEATVSGWQSFVKFVQERHLLEKGVETAGRGYEWVAARIGGGGAEKKID